MNVAGTLIATAERLGGKTALKLDDVEWTYRAAEAASARVAALLRGRGVTPGDRVGVMLPNVPELAVVYYGILRSGGVVVPVDVLLDDSEVAFYLGDSGAKLLFAWHAFAEVAEVGADRAGAEYLFVTPGEFGWLLRSVRPDRDLCERAGGDTAVVLYRPAGNGRPAGDELTHASLACDAETVARLHGLVPDDVSLDTMPLVHSVDQASSLNATIGVGGCLSLLERFDAGKALRVIARDGVTVLQGEPAMYAALLEHLDRAAWNVSTLRICVSLGAPMPAGTRRGIEEAFGCKVVEAP